MLDEGYFAHLRYDSMTFEVKREEFLRVEVKERA